MVAKCHPKKEFIETKKTATSFALEDDEVAGIEDNENRPLTASQERLFEADRDYKAHSTIGMN